MSPLATDDALWPMGALPRGLWRAGLAALPAVARLGLLFPPVRLGGFVVALRQDDVREVFATDAAFGVPYEARLRVVTGGEPFLLGLPDGAEYRAALAALRGLLRLPDDAERVGRAAEAAVAAALPAAAGEVDAVALFRAATFSAVAEWLGIPEPGPKPGRLAVWGTRLFGFQFGGGGPAPEAEARVFAEALGAHVTHAVAARRAARGAADDLLGRALAAAAPSDAWFDDCRIRTALLCLLVGGPPQPPMLAAHALNQLLRRPNALAAAEAAAHAGEEDALRRIVREAMRFDPLAPALERIALRDQPIAHGTWRARGARAGDRVFVAIGSAMRDGRRVAWPERFDALRPDADYLHFGHGLHECYGRELNAELLHRLLAPLLRRGVRRAGRLVKRGAHAERLFVAVSA